MFLRPFDCNRFKFNSQCKNVTYIGRREFGYCRTFIGSPLNETLVFQFDECLAYERNSSAKLLSDFAFNDGGAWLNRARQNCILHSSDDLISFRDRLNQLEHMPSSLAEKTYFFT